MHEEGDEMRSLMLFICMFNRRQGATESSASASSEAAYRSVG